MEKEFLRIFSEITSLNCSELCFGAAQHTLVFLKGLCLCSYFSACFFH